MDDPGTLHISSLRNRYANETTWIIGKGPSLLRLTAGSIGPGPIITLNQAVVHVEPLNLPNPTYSMQKDRDEIDWRLPRRASLLVHTPESGNAMKDYRPRYEFSNEQDFGIPEHTISVVSAIHIARLLGSTSIHFVCCDASAIGDYRTIPGYRPPLIASCYPTQRGKIEEALHATGLSGIWITP